MSAVRHFNESFVRKLMGARKLAGALMMVAMVAPIAKACAADSSPGSATIHSCSPNYTDENKLGKLSVQQRGPGTRIAWGVYPKLPAERYKLSIWIDGKVVDGKNQSYPPHGSVPPQNWNKKKTKMVPTYHTGQIFKITGKSYDTKGNVVQAFYIKCRLV